MKRLTAIMLAILMLASLFTACGGDKKKEDEAPTLAKQMVGSWVADSDGVRLTFTFRSNGTGYVTMLEDGETESIWTEYRVDGEKLVVTNNGVEIFNGTVSKKGKNLVMAMDGAVREFVPTTAPEPPKTLETSK